MGSRDGDGRVRLAYLPLFVRDFLTDPSVLQMRWIDQAIYLRMLMASWEAGPLPDDDEMIVRLIGAHGLGWEIAALAGAQDPFNVHDAVRGVLESVWELGPRGWTSPRLERERAHGLALAAERSKHGLRGAQARWSNARAMPEHSPGNGKPMPSQAQAQAQVQEQKEEKSNPPPTPPVPGGEHGRPDPDPAAEASRGAEADAPPKAGKKPKREQWTGTLPENLQRPDVEIAWADWLEHRAHGGKGGVVTQRSGDMALKQLAEWGPDAAIRAIRHAIASNYQGLFAVPSANGSGGPIPKPSTRERVERGQEEMARL
jgi:uncharacterized protein YdaU (DUF1376 family)